MAQQQNQKFEGTVLAKSTSKNAFMLNGEIWYNVTKRQVENKDEVYQVYEQLKKKDKISGESYSFNGKNYLSKLVLVEAASEEKPKEEPKATTKETPVKQDAYIRKEDPEKQDQIARGNAVNAISTILASCQTADDFKLKMAILYAEVEKLQDYIRNGRK